MAKLLLGMCFNIDHHPLSCVRCGCLWSWFWQFCGRQRPLLYRKSNKELPKKEPNVDDPCVCLFIIISFRDRAVTFAIELVAIEVPTTCCCWLGCYRISKNGNSMFGVLFLVSCAVYLK